MKEERFFYDPDVSGELPQEEAHHAAKVLRLGIGDEIRLMDGKGNFYRAVITAVTNHRCTYRIEETEPQEPAWTGHLHLAMAPTKLMDRVEWFAEKATEIGFDELTFLDTQFSERKVVKEERIDKILVSAMKQSHKAWLPKLNGMTRFKDFINQDREGDKFICHCYDLPKDYLLDVIKPKTPSTVLIGPEGDFSMEEVKLAMEHGYKSVSLGRSRLRTETAALVAVHMMQLKNMNQI
ncbi:MAG: 16S rRNA (uracil(1498)-N(3))-methyltransferase [Bacteroidaceae bacterium]|nr:16S rRNA (uracil(1498)-N(3))-methyltransferase [Bacteroidaceae bacterium]